MRDGLRLYLDALFGAEPAGGLIEVRYKLAPGQAKGMGQLWHDCAGRGAIVETVLGLGERTDVYIGAAPRRQRRGGRDAIESVHALWADCDGAEALEALRRFRPLPAIVIRSGSPSSAHAYWPLSPPVTPDEAERANRKIAHELGADPRSTDAARILRPPGTRNHKHDPPARVEVARLVAEVFELDDVAGRLPAPPDEGRRSSRTEQPARPVDGDHPVLAIPTRIWIEALTGMQVGRDGKVRCPFPDHEDRTPSCHVYDEPEGDGIFCFGCGRGGTIVDVGAALYGIEPRGAGYHEILERLETDLRKRAAA